MNAPRREEPAPRLLEPSSALAAIERERFHSYSSLVRNLHWLAAALVVLYSLLYPAADRLALWSLAGLMMVYTLLLHSRLLARLSVEMRIWLETAIDLAWITVVILWTGDSGSPFVFLYYIVLYASTPTASRRQTYGKAAVATLLILGVAWLAAGRGLPAGAAGWWAAGRGLVWPLTGLWLVAYFSAETGMLGADLHRSLFVAAHTDALTGLPNLRYFTAASNLRSKLGPYTIVMIDIDRLKTVNDTFGHALGSALIRAVADAIRSAARSGDDLCSRVGGDEFIVRLAGATADGAVSYCRRVRAHLADHPLALDGVTLPISISMGLASYPEHGRTLSEITDRADQALYRSKREGRSRDHVWAA
ncbi:MAG TPA: GGDEF domain-containing protein [Thermoanaerobaculia bacterium]